MDVRVDFLFFSSGRVVPRWLSIQIGVYLFSVAAAAAAALYWVVERLSSARPPERALSGAPAAVYVYTVIDFSLDTAAVE